MLGRKLDRRRDNVHVLAEDGILRVGTRGSTLALRQTERVVRTIREAYPDLEIDVQPITTTGDDDKESPLTEIGGQGVFAKELQEALLSKKIDIAVHSVKDLTSTLPEGLMLAAITERTDARDVLISNKGTLIELPKESRVGTSSRRRIAALKHARPDLEVVELRGNIDTRVGKVLDEEIDAAILAAAGILRMHWSERITQFLGSDAFVPAPGQGALGIECLAGNWDVRELVEPLNDDAASLAVRAERTFLRTIGGGCTSPIGAFARVEDGQIRLKAMLASEDLATVEFDRSSGTIDNGDEMATELAQRMMRAVGITHQGAG